MKQQDDYTDYANEEYAFQQSNPNTGGLIEALISSEQAETIDEAK